MEEIVSRYSIVDLRRIFTEAPAPITPLGAKEGARLVGLHYPSQRDEIIWRAEEYLKLEFSYLGWRRSFTSLPLPWTSDWNSGRVWESSYYADIDYSEPDKPSDVKSCWEPSRFHFGVVLGQACLFAGDVRYRDHFFTLLRDWLEQNPLAHSINWTSPLEVAIRGINLAAAASFFSDAPEGDIRLLIHALALHGAFVFRNLEYTDVRGNHYTGNIVGLLLLGFLLEKIVPEARAWRQYAEKRIPQEILLQYLPDGVNQEKSIPYHRFVTELFLLAVVVLQRANVPIQSEIVERLGKALEFTRAYTRPDGMSPVVGDNDNARALPLSVTSFVDHRHLLAVGTSVLPNLPAPEDVATGGAEATWLLGKIPSGTGQYMASMDGLHAFESGGFYVLRNRQDYLFIDAGHVGLQSGGCHGHHDMLSFELILGGTALVIDSGCPCYTGDIAMKNRFRSTSAHNTAVVDGVEQGTVSPTLIWHLGSEARPEAVRHYCNADGYGFEGSHTGYMRLPDPVMHRRSLELHFDGSFHGVDRFFGNGAHTVDIFFHLAAEVTAVETGTGTIRLDAADGSWIFAWNEQEVGCSIQEAEVSPAYGELLPTKVIQFSREGPLPWSIAYRIQKV